MYGARRVEFDLRKEIDEKCIFLHAFQSAEECLLAWQ